ncbi:chorismate mutase [Musa troglodytarum]|uniref:Chorismate mutase n=1 Tax=Musa troglodytarum TaxID=320322 RepID=A0A9E7HR88_9LILI|nr:chorismate mutase [Musa troglodytarum]
MAPRLVFSVCWFLLLLLLSSVCGGRRLRGESTALTLESVRKFLTREEDSIVFSLIERAKYPRNAPAYDPSYLGSPAKFHGLSLVELFVRETEAVQAKAGRYENPVEIPFFPRHMTSTLAPPYDFPNELHAAAAAVNVSGTIWREYLDGWLPQITSQGDDGNYAPTAAADLVCLQVRRSEVNCAYRKHEKRKLIRLRQALSRRIHYGRYVAEAKYRDAPQDYNTAIRAQDRDALMKLLTFEGQEDAVKRRVEEKAKVFGQDVTLGKRADGGGNATDYKVDPVVVYRLYGDWVIPMTKMVQVEYLLRRLD